jgi:ADP-ribose pyrophosphatase YjhB (NUDIX family)
MPNSLIPAASAIVVNANNEILLNRRSDNDLWSVPGGAMELGESILQTVVREVKEETGLDVRPGRVTGIYTDPRSVVAFADGEVRQQFSICFACAVVGGTLAVSNESKELRFVTPDTIDDLAISLPVRLRIRHYLDNRSEPAVT